MSPARSSWQCLSWAFGNARNGVRMEEVCLSIELSSMIAKTRAEKTIPIICQVLECEGAGQSGRGLSSLSSCLHSLAPSPFRSLQ